jgi:hypothetical protein
MLHSEYRRPLFRLVTAVVFAVAALLVSDLKADEDTCTWHYNWCVTQNGGSIQMYNCQVWPENPSCHTCLIYCSYGPYYTGCDTCSY